MALSPRCRATSHGGGSIRGRGGNHLAHPVFRGSEQLGEANAVRHAQFGTRNYGDTLVVRRRGPWFHAESYTPPPITWVNWTLAGPRREELHMKHGTFRRESGADNQRWEGMHTSPVVGVIPTTNVSKARRKKGDYMRGLGQDKITVPRYRGQSFSSTTKVLT